MDSSAFVNSAIQISDVCGESLQLANDGRIYSSRPKDQVPNNDYYLGVIDKPWEQGTACNFNPTGVYPGGRRTGRELPNILLDYLYRFEWEGDRCQYSPVTFIPHFRPAPDSVRWFFGEFAPGSTSTELSPTYAFQFPGIKEVRVDIWYPTGQIGPSQITVSDSGAYWVKAWFLETGCTGYDTIHVGLHLSTTIDETDLIIIPTACNGTNGSITRLYALGSTPFAYQWLDLSGNPFGNYIDATGLPAGQYYLTITDANDCQVTSPVYTVHDAGDLQVIGVQADPAHCHRSDGRLVISAWSPSGSVMEYSMNDGQDYQPDSIFENLPSGEYIVRIRDINGCEGFWDDNPVNVGEIPGPWVQQVAVTDETDGQQNGAIEITATASTPVLLFSIDDGNSWQSNNGTFNGLAAGTYFCIVRDGNDCDTVFTVEIQNIILTYLQAVTGPGSHCLGNSATVPVEVDNFTSVAEFQLKIGYNKDNLQCEGYANVHPELSGQLTGWVDVSAGEITLQWSGMSPVTFAGQQTVADLVFTPLQAGPGLLDWYTGAMESYFANPQGDPIPAEFHTGQVNLYEPPHILLSPEKTVCEGQMVSIMGIVSGNQPPISYLWTYPDGSTTENDPFFFASGQANAGDYTLLATDAMGCTDEKTIRLVVGENPVAAFHGADTLEVEPGYILSAGTGLAHYQWNTGDTTESIGITAEGMYTVGMESLLGCTGVDSVYIRVIEEPATESSKYFYIPNAFTPDGDGKNDVFMAFPNDNDISHFSMQVSDRWGGRIFESDDISIGWDGTKNGKPCPVGVYVYRLTFRVEGAAGEKVIAGTVALVR